MDSRLEGPVPSSPPAILGPSASSWEDLLATLPSQHLLLPRHQVSDSQLAELLQRLATQHHGMTQTLNLEGNLITDVGAEHLGKFLQVDRHLTELDISFNHITARGCVAIAAGLASNTTLRKLSLIYNPIENEGAEALGEALTRNHTLTDLLLYRCSIGDQGAFIFSNCLIDHAESTSLRVLDLGSNRFKSEAVQAISGLIRYVDALESLSLRSSDLHPHDVEEICSNLVDNSTLKTLDLRNNAIGDRGAEQLAAALPQTQLQILDLQNNSIGERGIHALVGALRASMFLVSLNLSDNKANVGDFRGLDEDITVHLRKNKIIQDSALEVSRLQRSLEQVRMSSRSRALSPIPIPPLPQSEESDFPEWKSILFGAASATLLLLLVHKLRR
eukprot:m.230288 g.230288  ORF g.230288 m.230288 type:complete len:389 (-) comp54269_c0_seq1:279-1445(-)